jgi:8-oxo-dGTP pyrophosphatase MutT (NUDIX family)
VRSAVANAGTGTEQYVVQASNRVILDVHLLLVRDRDVLLSRRRGGYGAGQWHLPSGKAEAGEPVTNAVIREAYEEVGATVAAGELQPLIGSFAIASRNRRSRVPGHGAAAGRGL